MEENLSYLYLFNENSRIVTPLKDGFTLDDCVYHSLCDLDFYTKGKKDPFSLHAFFDLYFIDLLNFKASCLLHCFFSYSSESNSLSFSGKYRQDLETRPQVFKENFILNTDKFAYQDNVTYICKSIKSAPFARKDI